MSINFGSPDLCSRREALASGIRVALLLFCLVSLGRAEVIYNYQPDMTEATVLFNMVDARGANYFTLSAAATVGNIRFWVVPKGGNSGNPISEVAWGIYANAGGAPGALLDSGASVASSTLFLVQGADAFYQVDFTPVGIGPLSVGAYWLELHDGASLTDTSQPLTYWVSSVRNSAPTFAECGLPCGVLQSPYPFLDTRDNQLSFELFDNSATAIPEPGTARTLLAGFAWLVLIGAHRRKRGWRATTALF